MPHQELTLDDALSDPLVRMVMAADRVDPQALRAILNSIASTLDRAKLKPQRGAAFHATNCA